MCEDGNVGAVRTNEEEKGSVGFRELSKVTRVQPGLEPRSDNPGPENSQTSSVGLLLTKVLPNFNKAKSPPDFS